MILHDNICYNNDPIIKLKHITIQWGFSPVIHGIHPAMSPICAMITATQVCRRTVDLPPMLGPVTIRIPADGFERFMGSVQGSVQ